MRINDTFKPESGYKAFLLTLITTGIAYGLYKGILDNYLAEVVGMGEFDRGLTEFFREIPGLMLIFVLAIFYSFSAERMYKMGAALMMIGMTSFSLVPAVKWMVILSLCINSLGEHIQLGMKNTLSLEYSKEGKGGEALGYQNAMYQFGNLAGYIIIIIAFFIFANHKPYRPFFFIAACVVAVSFIISQSLKGKSETDKTKSRFYFNRSIWRIDLGSAWD